MKRFGTLLLTIVLMKITCISQTISNPTNCDTIVSITSEQLKYANLIFAEHSKLLNENNLLYTQINNYKDEINVMNSIDSCRVQQLSSYEDLTKKYESQIKSNSNTLKYWKIGSFTIGIGLLLALILK